MPTLYCLTPPASRSANVDATLRYTPETVKQWLSSQPPRDALGTAQALLAYLNTLQRANLEGADLFALAEILRPACQTTLSDLLNSFGETYPLSGAQLAAAEFAQQLCRQVGQLYGVWLQQFDNAPAELGEIPLGLLLHRLLRVISQLLLIHACLHIKAPAWLWRDLHAVYRLALQKKLNADRYADRPEHLLSLDVLYRQALLLGMSDPAALQSGELLALYAQFEQWAPLLRLHAPRPNDRWRVYLDQDRPPMPVSADQSGEAIALDLSAALQTLNSLRAQASGQRFESTTELTAGLLNQLALVWQGKSTHGPRVHADGLRLVSGLRAIHTQLYPAAAGHSVPHAWDAAGLTEGTLACDSSGGDGGLTIGGLLAHVTPPATAPWGLAVIERIQLDRLGGVIKFGLRPLSDNVEAAGLQPTQTTASKKPQAYQRALLYRDAAARTWVVLESQSQQEGVCVRLLTDKGMAYVRLVRRENLGWGCCRFECVAAVA